MNKQELYTKAVAFAESCVGYKEKKANTGFVDLPFENLMKQVGHISGWAWCMLFAKLCWMKPTYSGKSVYNKVIDETLTAGAVQSYNNARIKTLHFVVDRVPEVGAIGIMQNYKDGKAHWTGHAYLVKQILENSVRTIEGNTNADGGREGDVVAIKQRPLIFTPKENGLVQLGFIKIK